MFCDVGHFNVSKAILETRAFPAVLKLRKGKTELYLLVEC